MPSFNLRCSAAPVAGLALAVIFAPSITQSAVAANLGDANSYNIFVFGNLDQSSDAEGRVAVGGDAILSNFGTNTKQVPGSPTLLVGGNLDFMGGQVNQGLDNGVLVDGDAQVGGDVSNSGFPGGSTATITGDLTYGGTFVPHQGVNVLAPGQVNQSNSLPGDIQSFFAGAYSYLSGLSDSLAALDETGTQQESNGPLQLLANNSLDLNVFNIKGSVLSGLTGKKLEISAPAGSTVVVNVEGAFDLGNFGIDLKGGIDQSGILFNVKDGSPLNLGRSDAGISFLGSLLAPDSVVTGQNGNIEGTLIARSLSGSLEAHNHQFAGDLPVGSTDPSAAVPTPALLPGLLGFAAAIRKRYKAASA